MTTMEIIDKLLSLTGRQFAIASECAAYGGWSVAAGDEVAALSDEITELKCDLVTKLAEDGK